MIRYLMVLFCFFTLFGFGEEPQEEIPLPTPEQLATLSSEPSFLIGGIVHPMSGLPSLKIRDLFIKGAQELSLTRIYIPPYIPSEFTKHQHCQDEYDKQNLYFHLVGSYRGWVFFPHLKLKYDPISKIVRLCDLNGSSYDFKISESKTTLLLPHYSISNAAGDTPNGKYDPRNTKISIENNENTIVVFAPDGTQRFYERYFTIFLLEKEVLPNGKILKYHYENGSLKRIDSMDPNESSIYASLHISYSRKNKVDYCHIASDTGLSVDYEFETRIISVKIKKKKYKEEWNYPAPLILKAVSSPFYRHETLKYNDFFLLESYSGKKLAFEASHTKSDSYRRIYKLSFPVGHNDAYIPLYQMTYQPPIAGKKNGSTLVKNGDGTSIIYHYSKNLLLTSIQYFGQDGLLKKEKNLNWTDNNWLQSVEMKDGGQNLLFQKTYDYDAFGNPVVETFTGDLTGEESLQDYAIRREFSKDGRHLLLKEEHDNGKTLVFTYLPNSNLVTSKFTKDHNQIILREFFIYDECHNLIQTIHDNGDDLFRTMTSYTLRQQAPFLHMPEWIEEKFLDGGNEKLLKRKHLLYDQYGNVSKEEIYDANGDFVYAIEREYNERGDLLFETNPLGQKAVYDYDDRSHCLFSSNFSGRGEKRMRYDAKGRLRHQKFVGDDGIVRETAFDYDVHDRLIEKKDPNVTRYTYDPLSGKKTKTQLPSILSNNELKVEISSTFDPFGRELTRTDANGNMTKYRYNAYGNPTEIIDAKGNKESFRYNRDGGLESYTDKDGLTIKYIRDVLGRVLKKTFLSVNGKAVAEERFSYNGFSLLTHIDREGNVSKFDYDGAGRKIREDLFGHVTEFHYDALGWLSRICKLNGNNSLFILYKRDLEGRILEESKQDALGNILFKISYAYDGDGNQTTVTRDVNGQEAVDVLTYDSEGRLISYQDAASHVTKRFYNDEYVNSLNQKVHQITITDPCHVATVLTKDAFNRTVKREIFNKDLILLSSKEKIYDPHGNLTHQIDHVYENGEFKNSQTICYSYSPLHQKESVTQGTYTSSFSYFPSGKLKSKALSNGVSLDYAYDPLGYISSIKSSDGIIEHAFEHNRLGHLQSAVDEKQNLGNFTKTDPFGNVTEEIFPNGLQVRKTYDDFNRLLSLQIQGNGEVRYEYDPLYLRKVTRDNQNVYSHEYVEYDLSGNLVLEKMIGNLGVIEHGLDLNGQEISITSPYSSENGSYDAVGNLTEKITNQNVYRFCYDDLSQLCSEDHPEQSFTYEHDSLYNRVKQNSNSFIFNEMNQDISVRYDLNGNQTEKGEFNLIYDPLDQLIEAVSKDKRVVFSYDPLGRRTSKRVFQGKKEVENEHYLYHGMDEIGAFAPSGEAKNLRILGIKNPNVRTVAIELNGQVFAPILDLQNNINGLVGSDSETVAESYAFTAFGIQKNEEGFNPWRFASKRYDTDLGLIHFGKRDYDPVVARWLTRDPAGFIDSANLYQYVFNNPYRYADPDGQFVVAIPILVWGTEMALAAITTKVVVGTVLTFATSYAVYQGVQAYNNWDINRNHKGGIDPTLPRDPFNDADWEDVSHPDAKAAGHHEFKNKKTGERIRFDESKEGESGHEGRDHFHRYNPNSEKNSDDKYLDENGKKCAKGSDESHLYPE